MKDDEEEQYTAQDVADEVTSEDIARDDDETSNGDKWALGNSLVIPLADAKKGHRLDPLLDYTKQFIWAYKHGTGDFLLGWMLIADVQNDVFEALLQLEIYGDRTQEEVKLLASSSFVMFCKLRDKYVLDSDDPNVRVVHEWLM